ncbi:MAG: hypothetical protein KKD05_03605 [Candidatus Omnitrophica bacterium]|nr:hypothetical protein [Candidatus Omnitrophota bacterium]
MKKATFLVVLLAVVFASILAIPNNACAGFSFDEIKMVDSYSSVNGQNEFALDETPWLYLKLPENQLNSPFADQNFIFSYWQSPQYTMNYEPGIISGDREIWLSLASWDSIPNAEKQGDWNVYANFGGAAGVGNGTTKFTVNPEPISMILFLFGGMPLAASLYRKKKLVMNV